MITPTQMYWLVTLDGVLGLMVAIAILSLFGFIVSMVYIADTHADDATWAPVSCIVAMLLAMAGVAFIPSTKQMTAIVVVPKLANSEKVQTAGNKLYDLAVEWMDELKPRKDGAKEAK